MNVDYKLDIAIPYGYIKQLVEAMNYPGMLEAHALPCDDHYRITFMFAQTPSPEVLIQVGVLLGAAKARIFFETEVDPSNDPNFKELLDLGKSDSTLC